MLAPRVIDAATLRSNWLGFCCIAAAASLLSGSSGLGACNQFEQRKSQKYGDFRQFWQRTLLYFPILGCTHVHETHQKEEIEAVDDGCDGEHRLPVLAQNVEAHVALEVDVGVVDLGEALDLGRLVGVGQGHCKGEQKSATSVQALVRLQHDFKVHDLIVAIGEADGHALGQVQLGDVCERGERE